MVAARNRSRSSPGQFFFLDGYEASGISFVQLQLDLRYKIFPRKSQSLGFYISSSDAEQEYEQERLLK